MSKEERHTGLPGIRINYDALFEKAEGQDSSGEHPEEVYTRQEMIRVLEEEGRLREEEFRQQLEEEKKKAWSDGVRQGRKQAQEQIRKSSETVVNALDEVRGQIDELMKDVKPGIAAMIFDITEKILELPVQNSAMRERVSSEIGRIIDQVGSSMDIRIDVSGNDYELVREMLDGRAHSGNIFLNPSGILNPGEFRVDTNREQIVKEFRRTLSEFRKSVLLENNERREESF